MKTFSTALLIGSLLFISSCNKDDQGEIILSGIQNEITINRGDTLKVNLGNFGDEEGASIYKQPRNAKVSIVLREKYSSSITYKYYPKDSFAGKDTVLLLLAKGSDGASLGKIDTIQICILVK